MSRRALLPPLTLTPSYVSPGSKVLATVVSFIMGAMGTVALVAVVLVAIKRVTGY